MSDRAYLGIRYDDPSIQAEFEWLRQAIRDAEQARAPIAARHRQAERDLEEGAISDAQFRSVDKDYIAANNAIAAAQRAADAFLQQHRDYHAGSQ